MFRTFFAALVCVCFGLSASVAGGAVVDRSEFTTTSEVAPGKLRTQVSSQPLNFETDQGWQPIDTELERGNGGVARPVSVDGDVAIPPSLGAALELEHDGREVSFRLKGASGEIDVDDATAAFDEAMPGVDVSYRAVPRGVKETLTLASSKAPSVFAYDVRGGASWSAAVDGRGEVVLRDGSGAERYRIAAPLAWDSAEDPAYTNALALSVSRVSPGRWTVTLRPDRSWLGDPQRVWPVNIDPDFSWSEGATHFHGATDCYLASGAQANTTFCAQSYLQTGHYNRSYAALLQFPVAAAIPSNAVVSSATFRAYAPPATPKALASHSLKTVTSEWDSSATWNKRKPNVPWTTTLGGDVSSNPAYTSAATNVQAHTAWYQWSAPLATVQGWVAGSLPNFGFQLTTNAGAPLGNAYVWASTEASLSSQFPADSTKWPTLDVAWSVPDTTAPALTLSGELSTGQSSWRAAASGEITLSGADGGTGVKRVEVLEGANVIASDTQSCSAGACSMNRTFTLDLAALGEGIHTLTAAVVDGGNLRTEQTFTVRVDRADPALALTGSLVDDQAQAASSGTRSVHVVATDGGSGVVDVEMKVDGAVQEHVTQTCAAGGCSKTVDWSLDLAALTDGTHTVAITATDGAGHAKTTELSVVTQRYPLPDAPDLSDTSVTPFPDQVDFLYQGPQAVQTGLDPAILDERRTAVVTGKVFNGEGVPASGVTVSVADHPEFGVTTSRENGQFFLVVNGGAQLRIHYEVQGALPADRQVQTKWSDYVWADDVRLVAKDPAGTPVDFGSSVAEPQLASASTITDGDGTRTARVYVRPGTQAWRQKTNGDLEALTAGTVRVSEYTVGSGGPERMPADLPDATAYTYAAEFSVDEASGPGDKHVQFSKPVVAYLENFIGLPVGDTIPVGTYEWDQGKWLGDPDGRVVKVIGESGGKAVLDVTGFGAANAEELATFDIDDAELEMVAGTYDVGETLWRTEMASFSAKDLNKARWVKRRKDRDENPGNPDGDDPCQKSGSIIGCQTQSLGEIADLGGTPYSLRYQSNRTPGAIAGRSVRVPMTEPTVDDDLRAVEAEVQIAGQRLSYRLEDPTPNAAHTFRWDGKDGFGRVMVGGAVASVTISDMYPEPYSSSAVMPVGANADDYYWVVAPFFNGGQSVSWGMRSDMGPLMTGVITASTPSQQPIDRPNLECNADESRCWYPVDPDEDPPRVYPNGRESTIIAQRFNVPVPYTDGRSMGVGGFGVSAHHRYDTGTGTLFTGDGAQRSVDSLALIVETVRDIYGNNNDPDLALTGTASLTVLADGSTLRADFSHRRVIRDWPDGHTTVFAGSTSAPENSGDGGQAIDAGFSAPTAVAAAPDGSVYISDPGVSVVRKVAPDGVITRAAGNGTSTDEGGGRRGRQAGIWQPLDIAVASDGTLYIASFSGIHRLDPAGTITQIAGASSGGGTCRQQGNPCQIGTPTPRQVAVAPDGTVYWVGNNGEQTSWLYRYQPGEVNAELIGSGSLFSEGTIEGPYNESTMVPSAMDVDDQGRLWMADMSSSKIWRLEADNRITHIGLRGSSAQTQPDYKFCGENGPFRAACGATGAIARGPGGMYLAETSGYTQVRKVRPAMERYPTGESLVASEDGSEAYRFDISGRHLSTLDGRTERVIRTFSYDEQGRLSAINETDLGSTTFTYDVAGNATVTGPDGQVTHVDVNADGWATKVTDAAGAHQDYEYNGAGGLMTAYHDQRGKTATFTWSPTGRLLTDTSPRGGTQTLARAENYQTTNVTHQSAGGQTTTYSTAFSRDEKNSTVTSPSGAATTSTTDKTTTTLEQADGTTVTETKTGDPRWGSTVQTYSSTTKLPNRPPTSSSHSTSVQREPVQDAADPFAYESIIDTYTVDGRTTTTTYDEDERTETTESPMGRESQVEYDEVDRPVRMSAPARDDVTLAYDTRGRVTSTTQGAATTSTTYGTDGQPATSTDAEGRTTTFSRDAVGRETARTEPGGRTTATSYDDAGQIDEITAPDGREFAFTHDDDGNVTEVSSGARASTSTPAMTAEAQFDEDGRILRSTGADDDVTFSYLPSGNIDAITGDDGTSVEASYQSTGGRYLDAVATDQGIHTGFEYQGPLLSAVKTKGDGDDPDDEHSTEFGYDSTLRPVSETIDGTSVVYQYNNDDQITDVGAIHFAYDGETADLQTATAGSTATQYELDAAGSLASHQTTSGPTSPVYAETVDRDLLGRITTATETVANGAPTVRTFTYTPAGQLESVSTNGIETEHYGYDISGGLTSRGVGLASTWIQTDGHGRPTSTGTGISATWSTDGSLQSLVRPGLGITALTYDGLGRIKTITPPSGTTGTYIYDGAGNRVALRVGGQIQRRYQYGAGMFPRARLDADGDVLERYVYATNEHVPDLIVRRDGQRLRLILDTALSVRAVVDIDTGLIVQELSYDAYGNVTTDTAPGTQPFGFKGALEDPLAKDAGLIWMGVRAYQPTLARFATPDPAGLDAGWNLQDGLAGDPINLADADGNNPAAIAAPAGAAVGLGEGAIALGRTVVTARGLVLTASAAIGAAIGTQLDRPDCGGGGGNGNTSGGGKPGGTPGGGRGPLGGLSGAVRKKLGGLASRADEKAADVLKSRGGGASQVGELQEDLGQLTLRELAKMAVAGDRQAEKWIKMVKQAGSQGKGGK